MKRAAKHVYHVGDKITIVEPLIFKRVGYPLSLEDGVQHVEPLVKTDLIALFQKAGTDVTRYYGLGSDTVVNDRDYDRALHAIAYSYLKTHLFGGPDRTIHTELTEEWRGKTGTVMSKRVVKTGRRLSGYASWESDGGESPYLNRVKSHVILEIEPICFGAPFEIEECHVQSCLARDLEPNPFDRFVTP